MGGAVITKVASNLVDVRRRLETKGQMSTDLSKYNAAKKALAEAWRIDEVKDIRDKAVAMRMYAMQAKDRVLIDQATEIRLRAERRAGELLKDMAQAGERAVRKNMKSQPATSKLSDLNINKSQSSRWQKLADIPHADFEQLVDRTKQKACAAVDHAQQPKLKPKPRPKPKPEQPKHKHTGANSGDPIAACLAEVVPIMRAAIVQMDAEKRSVFFYELRKALRSIITELTAQDAEPDRWAETTGRQQ
jgi:hypothetical protein